MSVSSHLTPEPERRLWLILENVRGSVGRSDMALAVLTGLAGLELAFVSKGSWALLGAAVVGVTALSPLGERFKWLDRDGLRGSHDNLILPDDIVKYSHGELILKFDKYLGGGITATHYYEDLVGLILTAARAAVRKRRLAWILSGFVLAGQFLL